MGLTTIADTATTWGQVQHLTYAVKVLGVLMLTLLLSSCGVNEVVVEGRFPSPLLDKLPVTLGVYYKPEFREHEFFDEATTRGESDWVVKTGAAQVQMYNTLLEGMFERVVLLNELPRKDRVAEVGKQAVDAILVPEVNELQYSIPTHTKINVFEIWMRYRYELYSANGEQLADWTMTAYGKTPTAFLRSAEAAVNLAAVVALRDAGANFAVNFEQVPEVKLWLENTADRRATP
ncbi:hypothetical protein [Candidatus Litorirhabdus singularis]|uniref:hypothetical protein n=1 Tax=Candidatus Litorirhabdus singularis TaxID=2518993 RepID=UPI00242AD33C|nr:hypothetical protein [Candidatus Litorirhabdus singularis]